MAGIKYKGTDGQWHLMSNILVKGIDIVQTSGDSETYVMSQKAVTESISGVNDTLSAHESNNEIHLTQVEKADIDIINTNIDVLSGITSEDITHWDTAYSSAHTHTNKSYIDTVSGNVGTMAYENASSYSSATEVDTALSGKSNTGHTHSSNEITAMTNYTSAVTSTAISTSDSLNTAIGKLERALDGIRLCQITQAGYDALVAGGTVDSSTLYIITDN